MSDSLHILHLCVGFLRVLQFPPKVHRHTSPPRYSFDRLQQQPKSAGGDGGKDFKGKGQSGSPEFGEHLKWFVVDEVNWKEKAEVIKGQMASVAIGRNL